MKLLVLAYKFPPYHGIGARRWAKYCKYLAKDHNIEVHVVTTNWNHSGEFSWVPDVTHEKIHIHSVEDPVLKLINRFPAFQQQIEQIELFVRYKIYKYADGADWWKKAAMKKTLELIDKENIAHVVATGPPHSVNTLGRLVKQERPNIRLIQDLRDPWVDDVFWQFTAEQKRVETAAELRVLEECDGVISVTHTLMDMYLKKLKGIQKEHLVDYNGYDIEEKQEVSFLENNTPIEFDQEKVNICFFGTMGAGREDQMLDVAKVLDKNLDHYKDKVQFHVFGSVQTGKDKVILNLPIGACFNFHGFYPNSKIQYFMAHCDLHLAINSIHYPYAFGTKLNDALQYAKPLLLISPKGEMEALVVKNKLGYVISEAEEAVGVLETIMENKRNNIDVFNVEFDHTPFSVKHSTQELMNFIFDKNK